MEDPIILKILLYSVGSVLGAMGFVLRYIIQKLSSIVPEAQIRQMITDQAAPQDVKQQMIYERLLHIESLLYNLMENIHNDRWKPDSR